MIRTGDTVEISNRLDVTLPILKERCGERGTVIQVIGTRYQIEFADGMKLWFFDDEVKEIEESKE